MGQVPLWYRIVSAARYLNVAPWDLGEQSLAWLYRAEAAQSAEAHAEKQLSKSKR